MTVTAAYIFLAVIMAPALVKVGMDPLAVHLFILYWGMLSFITPPVAIGAFAAASIAGANAMRTGLEAMRLGTIIYFIPFFFVFNPALIMSGPWFDVITLTGAAILGVVLLSADGVGPDGREDDVVADEVHSAGPGAGEVQRFNDLAIEGHPADLVVAAAGNPEVRVVRVAQIDAHAVHALEVLALAIAADDLTLRVVVREQARSVAIGEVNVAVGRVDFQLGRNEAGVAFVLLAIRATEFHHLLAVERDFACKRLAAVGIDQPEKLFAVFFDERQAVPAVVVIAKGFYELAGRFVDEHVVGGVIADDIQPPVLGL
ncbi:MAG: TRAP transporter large permease subunit, partial [Rhodospirillales bacterium]|nr:TRAP transporter large permease subunit [Rhodospirillales bacterium]